MIDYLVKIINKSENIVFFGGAGVSTESGIPDFRSAKGIYNEKTRQQYTPEMILSKPFFYKYPEAFYEFYKAKLIYLNAKPNNCHKALADLEKMGKLSAIITQNIDGLHQAAGSKNVIELHGTIYKNYCVKCHREYNIDYLLQSKGIPYCECGHFIRPNIVLYEEPLNNEIIFKAISSISSADTLIIGGTSLVVSPAANLIEYFNGSNLVLINKSTTNADKKANLVIHDSVGKVLHEAMVSLKNSFAC